MDSASLSGGGEDDGSAARGPHNDGCCQDNAAADFSMLTAPDLDEVDFTKSNLWLALILVFVDPFYKPVIAVLEYKTRLLSQAVGEVMAFYLYTLSAYLHSTLALFSFSSSLKEQPLFDPFQNNWVLFSAYGLLLLGLLLKCYMFYSYGWKNVLGETYFKSANQAQEEKDIMHHIDWRPCCHPNGTASVLCLLAVSLLAASLAGVVISVVFGLAHFAAYHTEAFLLQVPWPRLMQNAQFTKIRAVKDKFFGGSHVSKNR